MNEYESRLNGPCGRRGGPHGRIRSHNGSSVVLGTTLLFAAVSVALGCTAGEIIWKLRWRCGVITRPRLEKTVMSSGKEMFLYGSR